MAMHGAPVGIVSYRCNICGMQNEAAASSFHRELAACHSCDSRPRFRGIIAALSEGLFGRRMDLADFPTDHNLRGVGFSDWHGFIPPLRDKIGYVLTFYEQEPRIDLTDASTIKPFARSDYVICSEVFEHIPRPLGPGFRNLRALLKPGGLLVFTVPYTDALWTIEHFPRAKEFRVRTSSSGHKSLHLVDRRGRHRIFDDLHFHGGGDTALEMRLFSRFASAWHLRAAGFTKIKVYDTALPEIGYYWPPIPVHRPGNSSRFLGYVMTARA
jgi:SAM-dependent methyltransferase